MSFRYALSAPIQDFYVNNIDYGDFGEAGLKSIFELKNQAMRSDAEVAKAIKEGEALQDITKYRTQAELALKGPQPRSTFDKVLGGINSVASIGSGLKGMGLFDGGFDSGGFSVDDAVWSGGLDLSSAEHIGSGGAIETVIGDGVIGPSRFIN